jgi:hypothetical protein
MGQLDPSECHAFVTLLAKARNGDRYGIAPGRYGLREWRRVRADEGIRGRQGAGGDEQVPDLTTLKLDALAVLKKALRGKGDLDVPLIGGIGHGSATQPQGCVAIATYALGPLFL